MVYQCLPVAGLGALLLLAGCSGKVKTGSQAHNDPGFGGSGTIISDPGFGGSGGTIISGAAGGPVEPPPLNETAVGFGVVRHLTRTEYNNTVRDLFGTTLTPADDFQPDLGDHGFDKDSASQAITEDHVVAFEAGSDRLIEDVLSKPELKARLVHCDLSTGDTCIRSTLEAFLPKAWRRPVQASEVDRLMGLAASAANEGGSPEEQLKLALRGALMSANFLYLVERDPDPSSTATHKLDDFELASRLSYFLWSSMPDDGLAAVAAQHTLQDDQALGGQLTRMLADPKASALVNVFAAQWMQLGDVPQHVVNINEFPMVTDQLKQSMVQETTLFFQDLITNNGPVRSLLAADYTFVNAGLSALYGLPGPQGDDFVRTSVAGTTRIGGVLGHSSFLIRSSGVARTEAVTRGVWVLDALLCAPSPPDPPDVISSFEKELMDPAFLMDLATKTGREFLAMYEQPKCAVCHQRFDPIGLGLENYDAAGQYRTTDVGKPIDASGRLDSGVTFQDAHELTLALANDKRLASCAAQKLFTFALARLPSIAEIDYLNTLAAGNDDALTSIIARLVQSKPFRSRHGEL